MPAAGKAHLLANLGDDTAPIGQCTCGRCGAARFAAEQAEKPLAEVLAEHREAYLKSLPSDAARRLAAHSLKFMDMNDEYIQFMGSIKNPPFDLRRGLYAHLIERVDIAAEHNRPTP